MTKSEIDRLYARLKPVSLKESRPEYTYWQLKTSEMSVSAYTSGKVVFQGRDLSWLEDEQPDGSQTSAEKTEKNPAASGAVNSGPLYPCGGSDEVGTGDYFGPVAVAAVIIPDTDAAKKLQALHITDSKAMTDSAILQAAPVIKEFCDYSIVILNNENYNRIYDPVNMNINRIKARMHNQAWLNLQKKHQLPNLCVVDQFCKELTYYAHLRYEPQVVKNLHFETKAESHYLAVAAASVLARAAFLEKMDAMSAQWNFRFPKGAGALTDQKGREFLQRYSKEDLARTAKLHFKNTQKITGHTV